MTQLEHPFLDLTRYLDKLNPSYVVGGSFASSTFGISHELPMLRESRINSFIPLIQTPRQYQQELDPSDLHSL